MKHIAKERMLEVASAAGEKYRDLDGKYRLSAAKSFGIVPWIPTRRCECIRMPKSYFAKSNVRGPSFYSGAESIFLKEVYVPRFQLGQKVVITGPITTKHRDRVATVIKVQPNRHARPGVTSLDKYIVRFEDGDQIEFYDIQLMAAPGEKRTG